MTGLPTTDRGDLTRRQILDAAASLFARKGYLGTSINDLMAAAGVTKGGFYFHFPAKEDLALAVVASKQADWLARVGATTAGHERALDRLRAMSEALIDLHESDPSFTSVDKLCRELGETLRARGQPPSFLADWVELTASLLATAQHEGDIRPDVDAGQVATVAVAAFSGVQDISQLDGGGDLRERMRLLSRLLLEGLLVRAPLTDHA